MIDINAFRLMHGTFPTVADYAAAAPDVDNAKVASVMQAAGWPAQNLDWPAVAALGMSPDDWSKFQSALLQAYQGL